MCCFCSSSFFPSTEITILLARSGKFIASLSCIILCICSSLFFPSLVFPVHPLCAAIQSIGVCKRILEKDTSSTLGHIVIVPILVHGLFDFSLMALSVLTEQYGEDSPVIVYLSFLAPVSIVILAFFYYFLLSELQVHRLKVLDNAALAGVVS